MYRREVSKIEDTSLSVERFHFEVRVVFLFRFGWRSSRFKLYLEWPMADLSIAKFEETTRPIYILGKKRKL